MDRGEFAATFRDHFPYVVRLATVMTGDRELARDVAQEVFIAVLKGLPGFRGDSSLRTWIYQITLRMSGRHLARRRRQEAPALDLDALPGTESAEGAAALAELAAALARLPFAARSVLSLVAIDGLSHQEAADVLGVPAGTVASRLHAARQQLSAALTGNGA